MKILFVQFFCVVLPPFLNVFSQFHTFSVLYYAHLCLKCSLLSLIFLKRSLVFPILFFPRFLCIDYWGKLFYLSLLFGTLHSNVYIFPFSFAFSFSSFLGYCKASSDNHVVFLHLFFLGLFLITASCTISQPLSIILQALCLSHLIPWIYLSLSLYNCKGFDLGHTWMVLWFSLLSSI